MVLLMNCNPYWAMFAGRIFIAIHRAVDSCKTQKINVEDHFREVTKMIDKEIVIVIEEVVA